MPPDVFKILKDLELKSVGLDPQTNKMQEGYFVAFRSVGLPIHGDDFANPWSPLGVNLQKDIPKTDPADPATAPKTGSGQLSENTIFSANIAKSMQSYLNTFLLVDDKLRMNNQYSVMPSFEQGKRFLVGHYHRRQRNTGQCGVERCHAEGLCRCDRIIARQGRQCDPALSGLYAIRGSVEGQEESLE